MLLFRCAGQKKKPEFSVFSACLRRPDSIILGLLVACSLAIAQTIPLDALLRGGRIHYAGSRYERAKEQFTKALDYYGQKADNPKLAEIHIWLGLSEARLRHFETASGHFDKALTADSASFGILRQDQQKYYWAWTALITTARRTYNRSNYDSSLTYALVALKLDPAKSQAYSLVANSYSSLGRYEDMLSTAREMLKLNAKSPEAFSLIGLYYLQKPDTLWSEEMKHARWDSCNYYYEQAIVIYESRFSKARGKLGELLKITDEEKLDEAAWNLVEKSRTRNQEELKRYIEEDLGAAKQLAQVAQLASQLFYAGNNLNISSSRAGSAVLRAASETKDEHSTRFRARAESLFQKALKYDSCDFATMFNLGIAQYQNQNDSLAQTTFEKVINGTVVPLAKLPDEERNSLLALITPKAAKIGYLKLGSAILAPIDSILATIGYPAGGYRWLYFPKLRNKEFVSATVEDVPDIFLSLESPKALENIYLLLGISQTGIGLSFVKAKQKDAAKEKLEQALINLNMVTALNPQNAEAYHNMVHCYRETNQKKKAEQAYKKYEELSQ